MGDVLRLDRFGSSREGSAKEIGELRTGPGPTVRQNADDERRKARHLIASAAAILSGIGESERRVSWLLEDCAGLIAEEQAAGQASPSANHK